MILLIDNYDSFTYNLKDYFGQLGHKCLVIRNDEKTIEEIRQLEFDRIVLSPGPERPESAGVLNQVIKEFHKGYPIFGICLGHQAIGEFFGAKLVNAKIPMHGKVSPIVFNKSNMFNGLTSPINVCRYHSLILEGINNTPLIDIARTKGGELMAIEHKSLPIWGVQFHPEAILSEHGLAILENWLLLPEV